MKKKLSLIFFSLFLICCLSSQDYYTDDFKDFTFEMPDGWEIMDYKGLKYKVIYGASVNGYNQTMIFISQEGQGTIEEAVNDYIEELQTSRPDYKLLKSESFEINYKLEAKKLVIEIPEEKLNLKQYFYLFKHNDMLFICSALLTTEAAAETEEVLDAAMKTFQIIDKEE